MSKKTIKIFFSSDADCPNIFTKDAKEIDEIFNNIIRGNPTIFKSDLYNREIYINPDKVEMVIVEEVKEDE